MPDVLQLPRDIVELARIVAAEYVGHEQHTVAKVAGGLRERAETVDAADPLVAALVGSCNTLGGNVVADPDVIARVAYRAVADLLDRSAAEVTGQSRTAPDGTELNDLKHPRTETRNA